MAHYQPIARKFRPQTFSEVCGQTHVVQTLKNAISLERTSHAYLFCGPRGTGKTSLARIYAKTLNCENLSPDHNACNKCTSCIEISESRSLDVMEIDGASNRGIDDMRDLNESVGYASVSGKYKIYIIDEVHMLTKEAFNALLKTLEEPPEGVKFFFATTEPHKVLPTIASRCQRFDLTRISEEIIKEKLTNICDSLEIDATPNALSVIATRAEGGMRDAESLLDQIICFSDGTLTEEKVIATLGLIPKQFLEDLDKAFEASDHKAAFSLANEVFKAGIDPSLLIDSLLTHFRTHLLNPKSSLTDAQSLHILDYLIEQRRESTLFKQIHFEMVLLHIIQTKKRVTIDQLIARLSALDTTTIKSPLETKAPPKIEPPKAAPPPQPAKPPEPVATAPMQAVPPPQPVKPPEPVAPPKVEPPVSKTPLTNGPAHRDTIVRFASFELDAPIK